MFPQLLITSLRNIRKNKTNSFLNISGLAIGIACAGLIALWIEDETGFDRMHLKADQLYQAKINMKLGDNVITIPSTPRPMAAAIKSEIPGIVNTARFSENEQKLIARVDDLSVISSGRYTDPAFFDMFSFELLEGQQAFPQLYSIVITDRFAKKVFGEDKNLVGRSIQLDNKQDYTVSAVVKELPANSTLQFEWLASYDVLINAKKTSDGLSDATDWTSYGPVTFVELDKNADLNTINTSLRSFIQSKAADQKKEAFLFPVTGLRLYNEFRDGRATGAGRISQVNMFASIAWIILLIACINFMNLATAASQQRAREVGVRKVLGAGRSNLVIRFMTETMLMSLMAMIAGLILITLLLPAFNGMVEKTLIPDPGKPTHLAAMVVIVLTCGLVGGLYPAIFMSSFNPTLVLKGLHIKSGGAPYVRKGLVVLQFVVSVVFIISTIVVYNQIQHIKNRNLGFNRENLIELNPRQDISRKFEVIRQKLVQTGLVEEAALAGHSTLMGGNTDNGFTWQGKPADQKYSIAHRNVSPGYIPVSGMRILAGRNFTGNPGAEQSNVIVNESMAKLMANGQPVIGQVIRSPRDNEKGVLTNMTIVGVVQDYVYGDIFGKADPLIMFCKAPKNGGFIYMRLNKSQPPDRSLAAIEQVMKAENTGIPLEYKFVDDQYNQLFKTETLLGKVSGSFAVLAILISCLGLFGLAAHTAERRTKEIGIRKVLGASVVGVTSLLSREFLQLVVFACVLAFPVAWLLMNDWLQSYEYRISISWPVFAFAGIVATVIALLTISFHSVRAALANPVKSFKNE